MAESLDTKLIKLSLGKLKEFTALFGRGLDSGYAELFEKHAGAVIALLQPYGSSEEVKCLMTEYDKVLRQAKVFDQLPKYLLTFTSDLKVKNYREEHVKVEISLRRNINEFRYHSKNIVSKIENGKLKPEKPTEAEQKTELVIEPTGELQKSVTKSKYTPEKIKNMLTSYGKHYEESNDVKYAWNCVADEHDIPSGKAAEMAVRRHQKKNK